MAALLAAVLAATLVLLTPSTALATAPDVDDAFDTLPRHWLPVTGNWRADGNGAVLTDANWGERGHSLALVGRRLADTGSVTATFHLEGAGGATSWGGLHVQRTGVRDDYVTSGYSVLLRRNGQLTIMKATGTGVTALTAVQTTHRPADAAVTLTVEVAPGSLTARIGADTVTVQDATFTGGGISLITTRDNAMWVDHVSAAGLRDSSDDVVLPEGCVRPDGAAVAPTRGPVFLSDDRLDRIQARIAAGTEPQASAFDRLEAGLSADLTRVPNAPMIFEVPLFYVNPDAHRAARDGILNDANTAYRLALAYRLTGEEEYGRRAAFILDEWTQVVCFSTGADSALALSSHMPTMVFAAELLRGREVWPAANEAAFASMLRSGALPVAVSIIHRLNNWGSWGVVAAASINAYLGDEAALATALNRTRGLLDHQIAADGHLPEEVDRNNGVGDYGIWYTHFSLLPMMITAEIGERHGVDLYEYENVHGATLGTSSRLMTGWLGDLTTFPYFTGTDVSTMANVRTIDHRTAIGEVEHSISYLELAANHYEIEGVDAILVQERPMTTIHGTPFLTLTHGDLPEADPLPELSLTLPTEPVHAGTSFEVEIGGLEPGGTATVTIGAGLAARSLAPGESEDVVADGDGSAGTSVAVPADHPGGTLAVSVVAGERRISGVVTVLAVTPEPEETTSGPGTPDPTDTGTPDPPDTGNPTNPATIDPTTSDPTDTDAPDTGVTSTGPGDEQLANTGAPLGALAILAVTALVAGALVLRRRAAA